MLTKAEAQKLAEQELGIGEGPIRSSDITFSLQIVEQHIREFEYGWIFPYDCKEYLETGDIMFRLAGNGPLLVDKLTGKVWRTGSSRSTEYFVDLYLLQHYAKEIEWVVDMDALRALKSQTMQIIGKLLKCNTLERDLIFKNFPPSLTDSAPTMLTQLKYELARIGVKSEFRKKR